MLLGGTAALFGGRQSHKPWREECFLSSMTQAFCDVIKTLPKSGSGVATASYILFNISITSVKFIIIRTAHFFQLTKRVFCLHDPFNRQFVWKHYSKSFQTSVVLNLCALFLTDHQYSFLLLASFIHFLLRSSLILSSSSCVHCS